MIDLTKHQQVFARVSRIGNGKHGLLNLSFRQLIRDIDGVIESGWPVIQPVRNKGDNFYMKLPTRLQAPIASQDVINAEAAVGLQFFDDIIVSGGTQIYGVNLSPGQWIYCAPSGTRWLITSGVPSEVNSGINSFAANWTADRFGDFSAAPEQQTGSFTLADAGQSSPTTDIDPMNNAIILRDINEDGSQAVFKIYWGGVEPGASGFFVVDIVEAGATLTLSATLIRDRTQCLGTCDAYFNEGQKNWHIYTDHTIIRDKPTPCTSTYEQEWVPAYYAAEDDPPTYTSDNFMVGTTTIGRSLTGRIMSMYYKDNALKEVTADLIAHHEAVASAPTITNTGRQIYEYRCSDDLFLTAIEDSWKVTADQHGADISYMTMRLHAEGNTTEIHIERTATTDIYRLVSKGADVPFEDTTQQTTYTWSQPLLASWSETVNFTLTGSSVDTLNASSQIGPIDDGPEQCPPNLPYSAVDMDRPVFVDFSDNAPIIPSDIVIKELTNKLFTIELSCTEGPPYSGQAKEYRSQVLGAGIVTTTITGNPYISGFPSKVSYNPRDGRIEVSTKDINWV